MDARLSYGRLRCRLWGHHHILLWCRECKDYYRTCTTCGDHIV